VSVSTVIAAVFNHQIPSVEFAQTQQPSMMMTGSSSANTTATPTLGTPVIEEKGIGNRTTSSGGFTMAKDGSIVCSN